MNLQQINQIKALVVIVVCVSFLPVFAQQQPGTRPDKTTKRSTYDKTQTDKARPPFKSDSHGKKPFQRGPGADVENWFLDAMSVVRDLHPELRRGIEERMKKDPSGTRGMLRRYASSPRIRALVMMKRQNPAKYKLAVMDAQLSQKLQKLGHQYRRALDKDDKPMASKLKSEIEALVSRHFDNRLQLHAMELESLDQRVKEMRIRLERQKSDREPAIAKIVGNVLEGKPMRSGAKTMSARPDLYQNADSGGDK